MIDLNKYTFVVTRSVNKMNQKTDPFFLYYAVYVFQICLAEFVVQLFISMDGFIFKISIFLAIA